MEKGVVNVALLGAFGFWTNVEGVNGLWPPVDANPAHGLSKEIGLAAVAFKE